MSPTASRRLVAILLSLLLPLTLGALVALEAPATAHSEDEATTEPNYATADVDGNPSEWDTDADDTDPNFDNPDFFADMHRAGRNDQPREANLFLRYDCTAGVVYALVLTVDGVTIDTDNPEAFIKIDGATKVDDGTGDDGTPPDFSWVTDSGDTVGFEASFTLAEATDYGLDAHVNVISDGSTQTASTAEGNAEIRLDLDCPENGGGDGAPALTITKSPSSQTVDAGDEVTFTLTVSNNGSADATNVTVYDDLHDSLTAVSASSSQGSCEVDDDSNQDDPSNPNEVFCDLGTLQNGDTATVTITATTTADSCPSFANQAQADADDDNSDTSNRVTANVSCDENGEAAAALRVTKSATDTTVDAGDPVTFTITVDNVGDATAEDVTVTDDLDDSVEVSDGDVEGCDNTDTVDESTNVVTCAVGDLAPGESATVTITATTTADSCDRFTNRAAASSGEVSDASSSVVVNVDCEPGLRITKQVADSSLIVGDDVQFTLTVSNDGDAAAQDVVVDDDLHDALTGVTVQSTTGTCDPPGAGNTVHCELGDLQPGGIATISIGATTTAGSCDAFSNVATTASEADSDRSNRVVAAVECPEVGGELLERAAISLAKTADPVTITYVPGGGDEIVSYTYVIENVGEATLEGVSLEDDQLGTIDLPDTTLESGEEITVTVDYVVTAEDAGVGQLTNLAVVRGTGPDGEIVADRDQAVVGIATVAGEREERPDPAPDVDATDAAGPSEQEAELAVTGRLTEMWVFLATAAMLTALYMFASARLLDRLTGARATVSTWRNRIDGG